MYCLPTQYHTGTAITSFFPATRHTEDDVEIVGPETWRQLGDVLAICNRSGGVFREVVCVGLHGLGRCFGHRRNHHEVSGIV